MKQILYKLKAPVTITILFISITILISDYNFRWKDEKWHYSITSDGLDYYSYLTMVFVDHHFEGKNLLTGKPTPIKHYIGTAIFFLPFFSLAYLSSSLFSLPADGVSILFQIFITIGTLFYLILGLVYLSRFLKHYKLPDWIICTVLVASVLATNVFYYTVIAPGWSHIISFFLASFLLYHLKLIYTDFNKRSLFFIITSVSFLFWVRPTDAVIVVAIPFLAGSWELFLETIRKSSKELKVIFKALLVAAIPAACQLIMYRMQTGSFIIWSYKNEPFNFLKPEVANVLFSYAKGLFVYVPVLFLSLLGFVPLYRKSRFEFTGIVIYTLLNIYIISSWWCWNYGVTYGPRSFIGSFPVFFLLFGLFLNEIKSIFFRISVFATIIFLCIVIYVQAVQSENRILDLDYSTTKRGYWEVFLKTDKGNSGKYYTFPVDSGKENIVAKMTCFSDMERADSSWININTLDSGMAHSGKMASKVNHNSSFSTGIKKRINEIPYGRNVIIRVSGWFYITEGSGSYFALTFKNDTSDLVFTSFGMDKYINEYNHWQQVDFEMYMPNLAIKKEEEHNYFLICYLFNGSFSDCYMDDLKVEFVEYKKLDRILDIQWD